MNTIGAMSMPENFRYREVCLKGKPQHERLDAFRVRHPQMDNGRRAKIFAPFDALRGFGDAVSSKNVLYEGKIEPGPEAAAELNRRLLILKERSGSRAAGADRMRIAVTFYEPCTDENNDACGIKGRYRTVTGACHKVDNDITKTIVVDGTRIVIDDILCIEGAGDVFSRERNDTCSQDE